MGIRKFNNILLHTLALASDLINENKENSCIFTVPCTVVCSVLVNLDKSLVVGICAAQVADGTAPAACQRVVAAALVSSIT